MISKLKQLTIKNSSKLSYVNLDKNNCYKGWTTNFNLTYVPTNEKLGLNLKNETDLFLLFVLASSWSKTGAWENALYFTAYLKVNYNMTDFINGTSKIQQEINNFQEKNFVGIKPRKAISFRNDYYNSIEVLIKNWDDIKRILLISEKQNNWKIFIEYISSVKGLGSGKKKMRIKIPFILRELRCQKIYSNINGEYCCVIDERVRNTYTSMHRKLPNDYLKASKKVYKDFKDLYDIPAFAYNDFVEQNLI